MRESIGGTMLFWIVLFFLSIFIAFLAFVMKYAYVYKIKNSVLDYIERQEGIETEEQFRNKLTALKYPESSSATICKNVIEKSGTTFGVYYSIELHADLSIPLVYTAIPVTIKGETMTITTGLVVEDANSSDSNGNRIKDCVDKNKYQN